MNPRPPMELVDYVRELTQTHRHSERYLVRHGATWYGQNHVTRAPALLVQLTYAPPSMAAESHGGYASRPAASLEAVDTLVRIDLAAARWIRDLGEDDPLDTAACIRRLNGLVASLQPCRRPAPDCCTRHEVERDVRRWWAWARIATGWDSPAWKPDNTCPLCGKRGTLRVKLADAIGWCVDCHETWDRASIGLLADHIRNENHEQGTEGDAPDAAVGA